MKLKASLTLTLFANDIHLPSPRVTTAFVPLQNSARQAQSCFLAARIESDAATAYDHRYGALLEADPTVEAPLPPSYTECPFNGIMAGPKSFYRQASSALKAPKVFSFLHKDQPTVEVRGGKEVREVLRQEFTTLSSNAVVGISQKICGTESLRTARNREEHKALRQLVGVPLSPTAVEKSIPLLEAIGRSRIQELIGDNVSKEKEIVAWDMSEAMALDVTWQQILGLNLETKEEIATFHQKTHTWLKGMWYKEGSPEFTATMKSRKYLRAAIDKKIDQLLEAGESDGSTVGGLVFATMDDVEEEDSTDSTRDSVTAQDRTLSREEVVDNCLLLILAGTETTATNMANILLLMGLHPSIWQRVIEEQERIVVEHGDQLTPEALQTQACPYLDAVIHETMRVLPVTLVSKRVTEETIVADGTQIPKGWGVSYNIYLTHQEDDSLEEGHMDLVKGFKPERWLQRETRPGRDYIPFGAGPRQCPGNVLALTEMKAFLSLMAREIPRLELVDMETFDLTQPLENQIEWNEVSSLITPKDGVRIRVLPKAI